MEEEFANILWDRVLKINDRKLQQFIISILRYELENRDQERYEYKDKYKRDIVRYTEEVDSNGSTV